MTHKHFEAIAGVLSEAMPQPDWTDYTIRLSDWETTVRNMATMLDKFNPYFDRNRFITACGWELAS